MQAVRQADGSVVYLDDQGNPISQEEYDAGAASSGVSAPGGYASSRRPVSAPKVSSDPVAQNTVDGQFAYDTGVDLMNDYSTQAGKAEENFQNAEGDANAQAQ